MSIDSGVSSLAKLRNLSSCGHRSPSCISYSLGGGRKDLLIDLSSCLLLYPAKKAADSKRAVPPAVFTKAIQEGNMAKIKPQALLAQSKKKKGPSQIRITTIITYLLMTILIIVALYAIYKRWYNS